MRFAVFWLAVGALVWTATASPNPATDQVRSTADKIIGILKDPNLQGQAKKSERNHLILQELDQRFDWNAICRGCLGRHWAKLTRDQREQFSAEFKQFLEHTYLDRVEPYYNELDRIDYQGEKVIDNYASVRTSVVTKQKIEHPVEYRLEKSPAGAWRVYDVVIEGVSLVKNYRTQFDEILTKSSFDDLIKDLRTRTEINPQGNWH